MQDNYYNHMLETVLRELKEMVTYDDKETMTQYKSIDPKTWSKIEPFFDPLNEYVMPNGKRNNLMKHYTENLYPILKTAEEKKVGFMKKLVLVKVDDYDFRQILYKCDDLMNL